MCNQPKSTYKDRKSNFLSLSVCNNVYTIFAVWLKQLYKVKITVTLTHWQTVECKLEVFDLNNNSKHLSNAHETQQLWLKPRTTGTQREFYFFKFETFGLGQTNWAEIV